MGLPYHHYHFLFKNVIFYVDDYFGFLGDDSTPKIHRRTLTNPDPKKQPADRGKAPTLEPKNNPQYRSWDQSVSTPKRRKDGMMGEIFLKLICRFFSVTGHASPKVTVYSFIIIILEN